MTANSTLVYLLTMQVLALFTWSPDGNPSFDLLAVPTETLTLISLSYRRKA